jgi:hypothetical protein
MKLSGGLIENQQRYTRLNPGRSEVAQLATHERPAWSSVPSTEEAAKIVGLAQEHGWKVIVGVEPDQIEDLSDVHKLMRPKVKPEAKPRLPPKIGGNDYSPCRSGNNFKKCFGATGASPGA